MRLKEAFAVVTQEKIAFADENRLMKEQLALHSIIWPPVSMDNSNQLAPAPTMNQRLSVQLSDQFSQFQLTSPDRSQAAQSLSIQNPPSSSYGGSDFGAPASILPELLNYHAIGIDFVLAYFFPFLLHFDLSLTIMSLAI